MRQSIRYTAVTALLLLASACSLSCRREPAIPRIDFDTAVIKISGKPITVEIANTIEKRNRGLMYRRSLPADSGMLFVFEMEQTLAFWMKNTRIPLDIAFIKADGFIAQITHMEPHVLASYLSDMRAKYALEMNKGWFAAHGVKVGDIVEIPDEVAQSGE